MIILVSISVSANQALAAKPKVTKAKSSSSRLGTKFDFGDLAVNGKFQSPEESVTAVEDEKMLDDLLGVRKNFKDRLQRTAERH